MDTLAGKSLPGCSSISGAASQILLSISRRSSMHYNLNSWESNGAEAYTSVDEQCLLGLEESITYGMERVESGAMISHPTWLAWVSSRLSRLQLDECQLVLGSGMLGICQLWHHSFGILRAIASGYDEDRGSCRCKVKMLDRWFGDLQECWQAVPTLRFLRVEIDIIICIFKTSDFF